MNKNDIDKFPLTIELIPKTCWYSNVRSNVYPYIWDIIRKKCYKKANYKCEICGDVGMNQGINHPVECHEIWDYNDIKKTQTLIGLIALCPYCHKVKHAGFSGTQGFNCEVIDQLIKVNNCSIEQVTMLFDDAKKKQIERSKFNWTLNISYIEKYIQEYFDILPKEIYKKPTPKIEKKYPEPSEELKRLQEVTKQKIAETKIAQLKVIRKVRQLYKKGLFTKKEFEEICADLK